MTRQEHLRWAKDRALALLEQDPKDAWASLTSDCLQHAELCDHPAIRLGTALLLVGRLSTISELREFIESFN